MGFMLLLAYLNTLTFSCIQMVLYTTIPYIVEKTHVETANIVGAISVGSLIFAFMGPFWAYRSDKLGRRKVLALGMFGLTLSFAAIASLFVFNDVLSLSAKIGLVYLGRILYGLLASAIVPVSQAWQLDLIENREHINILTRNSMCLNLGRILGPILVLVKQVNFELVIYGASAWVFILFTSNLLLIKQTKLIAHHKKVVFKELMENWKKSAHESLKPILLALVFTSFIGVLHSFLGHHLKSVLAITGSEATLMFAKIILVLSILAIAVQQLSIIFFKSRWRPRLYLGASALVIGAFLMMNASGVKEIWLSIVFIALATATIPPVYLSLTSQSKENKKDENVYGKKLGLASIAHSLGYALGMALVALSLKMKILPPAFVVIFISLVLFVLAISLVKEKSTEVPTDLAKANR